MANSILVSVLFLISLSSVYSVQTQNGKIKITIGTTSGSTEVANFLINHLLPTYQQYKEFLDVEFVPWGKSVRNIHGGVACEFGSRDCWGNRMHRCVLDHLKGNVQAQVDYMACEFTEPFAAFAGSSFRCATAAGMRRVEADHCVNNPLRDDLDQQAEIAASQAIADINSVPYVVFNEKISARDSSEASRRLFSIVCFALADDPNSGVLSCQI